MPQNTKMLIGALVAAALAIATYYGLISQQTATSIETQTNQTLGTGPAGQRTAPSTTQAPTTQAPAAPIPQPPPQTPRP